jgi:hypothetical protein
LKINHLAILIGSENFDKCGPTHVSVLDAKLLLQKRTFFSPEVAKVVKNIAKLVG